MAKGTALLSLKNLKWSFEFRKKGMIGYLAIPVILAVMVGFLLNQVTKASLIYTMSISMTYAVFCALLVVWPVSTFLKRQGYGKYKLLKLLIWVIILTLISTVLAESFLAVLVYQEALTFSEAYQMYFVNLMLSAVCIYICLPKRKKQTILESGFVRFRTSDGIQLMRAGDIHFLYAKNKYVFVNLGDVELLADKTLQSFEKELPKHFVRVSRSHILNTGTVEKVKRDKKGRITFYLTKSSGDSLEIKAGVTYQRKLRHLIVP